MAKEKIKALYLRFDLADEDERRAYELLQNRDKVEFGSYTELVSRAVNEFFERRARLEADPYFETREKEDAFISTAVGTMRQEPMRSGTIRLTMLPRRFLSDSAAW